MDTFNDKRNLYVWVLICLVMGIFLFFSFSPTADLNGNAFAKGRESSQKEKPEWNVFNIYGRAIGSVDAKGNVTNRYGRPVGSADSSGTIFNVSKNAIGKVEPDGKILNKPGTFLGSVDANGYVYNVSGRKVGVVKASGNINLIGGAARLLILK